MTKIRKTSEKQLKTVIEMAPRADIAMGFDVRIRKTKSKKERLEAEQAVLRRALSPDLELYDGTTIAVCGDGDSWCNLLWPYSGYPMTLIDWLAKYYRVKDIGWPGDTLAEVFEDDQFHGPIGSGIYDFFYLSAGGVDFFTNLNRYIKKFDERNAEDPEKHIKAPNVEYFLNNVVKTYGKILRKTRNRSPKTRLVVHGYDHAIPQKNGRFLGKRFEKLGYDTTSPLPRRIIAVLIDRYYEKLEIFERKNKGLVLLLDCRGACKGNWFDELHGNDKAAKKIAKRFCKLTNIPFPPG